LEAEPAVTRRLHERQEDNRRNSSALRVIALSRQAMMKISTLLTGRGNNTLKDKNVLEVLGQPVLYYIANRQDLPKCYFFARNFWVLNVRNLLYSDASQQPWEFMGDKIVPYEIEESIDIHREIDLILAGEWLRADYPPSEISLLILVYFAKTIRNY
jgi:hypothetical protein